MYMIKELIRLVKYALTEEEFNENEFAHLTEEDWQEIYETAEAHSITPVLGVLLERKLQSCKAEAVLKIRDSLFQTVTEYEVMEEELKKICRVLDQTGIPYIPLKGVRVRKYYPKPWMRTIRDLDVLIPEKDFARAGQEIEEKLSYRKEEKSGQDAYFYAPSGVILELHSNLQENIEHMDYVLKRVWDYSSQEEEGGNSTRYVQSNEFYMFHMIAHMAYHFIRGECSIRAFMDIELLQNHMEMQEEEVQDLCDNAGIGTFYRQVQKLLGCWFGDREYDEVTKVLEECLMDDQAFREEERKPADTVFKKIRTFFEDLLHKEEEEAFLAKEEGLLEKLGLKE